MIIIWSMSLHAEFLMLMLIIRKQSYMKNGRNVNWEAAILDWAGEIKRNSMKGSWAMQSERAVVSKVRAYRLCVFLRRELHSFKRWHHRGHDWTVTLYWSLAVILTDPGTGNDLCWQGIPGDRVNILLLQKATLQRNIQFLQTFNHFKAAKSISACSGKLVLGNCGYNHNIITKYLFPSWVKLNRDYIYILYSFLRPVTLMSLLPISAEYSSDFHLLEELVGLKYNEPNSVCVFFLS